MLNLNHIHEFPFTMEGNIFTGSALQVLKDMDIFGDHYYSVCLKEKKKKENEETLQLLMWKDFQNIL